MSQYSAPIASHHDEGSVKGYISSESESKSAPSGSAKKRASRAGTRSVTTLSVAQLERKRANDREAQRAIRQRTKDHIETLERRISDLTNTQDARERLIQATQQRNQELEDENTYLRSQVGGGAGGHRDSFMLQIPGAESKNDSGSQSTATASSPQTRIPVPELARQASQSARGSISTASQSSTSQPDAWRQQHRVFSPGEPSPGALPEQARAANLPTPASWRGPEQLGSTIPLPSPNAHTQMEPPQRSYSNASAAQDRPQWTAGSSSYGYMVDPAQQAPGYQPQAKPMPYPGQAQAPQYQSIPPGPSTAPVHGTYSAPIATPHAEFQGLTMQSPASGAQQPHEHQGAHTPYSVSSSQISPAEYHPGQQHAGLQREQMAAPPYSTPATTQAYPQPSIPAGQHMPMEYHAQPQQSQYSYGPYHNNG